MADVYARIADADPALVAQIAEVLELRAADPQQAAMRQAYLGDIQFPTGARVLEVGCGTGAVTRELAGWPGVAEVVGLDPFPTFLASARRHGRPVAGVRRRLGFLQRARPLAGPAAARAADGRRVLAGPNAQLRLCRDWRGPLHPDDRRPGAAALVTTERIGGEAAAAFKAEARRRSASGQFFGHIAYASLVATLRS
jgi:SAM-dependent methyltransferase